jgi:hypothetical protein
MRTFDPIIRCAQAHASVIFFTSAATTPRPRDKVSLLAHERGYYLVVTGEPKTIDKDLSTRRAPSSTTPRATQRALYWAMTIRIPKRRTGACRFPNVSLLAAMAEDPIHHGGRRLAEPDRCWPCSSIR